MVKTGRATHGEKQNNRGRKMQIKERALLDVLGGLVILAIFFLLVIGQTANATYNNDDDDQTQTQDQGQHQGQDQGQDQTQTANASASQTQGNTQSINVNEAARPDDIKIRNTATAPVPDYNATSPCFSGWSAGVGAAGVNLGGGKSKRDLECDKRETARLLGALGEVGLALKVACATEAAVAALGDACGMTSDNVYVRVNDPVRYVERVTGSDTAVHEVSEEAVETCTESTTRAFEKCASK